MDTTKTHVFFIKLHESSVKIDEKSINFGLSIGLIQIDMFIVGQIHSGTPLCHFMQVLVAWAVDANLCFQKKREVRLALEPG